MPSSSGKVARFNLLQLTVDGEPSDAHSYIGLGLTPAVAVDLQKSGKGSPRDLVTTVRAFAQFCPFEIERPDRTRERFDSIVFANIHQMAKVATLSDDDGRPDDGAFEVITMRRSARLKLLSTALRASARSGAAAQRNRVRLHDD
jgi:diacylglycerol kinase (ATP)